MQLHNSPNKINQYLLLPSVPTPNGQLHLGHIGGPFLSADIFARHAQLLGHQAHIIAGTDSYESFVTIRAQTENKTPTETCNYYHDLITQDLALFNIQISEMVNPLAARWHTRYIHWHKQIFETLVQKNATRILLEHVLWNQHEQRYTTGCWLNGICPSCQTEITGYFCEKCGAHFRPEEVSQAHDRSSNHHLVNEKNNNLFMELSSQFNIQGKGINTKIEIAYKHFLQKQNRLFRLTANSKWGLPIPSNYSLPRSTLFNYGLMFAYFLFMGEIFGKLNDTHKNAFAHDSDVTTICTFGIDNAIPFLASTHGISSHYEDYKPFDYYFVNYFYHLNGSKFSTSRGHAIWANDIIKQKGADCDLVRLFLALIDVRNHEGNFNSDQFTQFYNNQIQWIQRCVIEPLSLFKTPKHNIIDHQIIEMLSHMLVQQQLLLQPHNFMPHLAAKLILDWQFKMENYNKNNQYFWLMKGLVLLACPFMPRFCQNIWHALGYENQPSINYFDLLPKNSLQNLSHLKIKLLASSDFKVKTSVNSKAGALL